jgi:PTS system nitrogen regulatory IIA component
MSNLADYTEPSLMVPLLCSRDASSITAELCSTLQSQGRISDLLPFYQAVINREALGGTVIAPGWALSHARIPGIPQLSFAFGRTAEPLAWYSGEPVNMVFLFAVPESEAADYLGLISGLAKLSLQPLRLERLRNAPTSRAMFEVLREIHLPQRRAVAVNA